jgi:peptidoglycan-associated lipoprotein
MYRGTVVLPDAKTGTFDLTGRLEAEAGRFSTLPGPPLRVSLPPQPPPPPKRVVTAADFNAEKVLGVIHFDFNRADIRDESRKVLESNREWLSAHPALKVLIEGHCDERGTNEYNLSLGDRRANAAKDYLIKAGIDAARLRTISYGEERPIDTGHTEAAWAANRRAEFVLED